MNRTDQPEQDMRIGSSWTDRPWVQWEVCPTNLLHMHIGPTTSDKIVLEIDSCYGSVDLPVGILYTGTYRAYL